MKKIAIHILSLLFISIQAFADDTLNTSFTEMSVDVLFEEGNRHYQDEKFEEAITSYQSIVDKGQESAEVYFNIGNSYFKMGDIAHAILYYEKAKMLDPRDEDIKNNLEMANLKTVDKVEAKPELPFSEWWTDILNTNLIDEWANKSIYLAYIGLFLMILFLFAKGILKKVSFFTSLIALFISIVFFFLGMQQKNIRSDSKHAIIFSGSVTVRSAPEDDGTKLFVIHEGTKVEILDVEGEWSEISLMNGNEGWVKTSVYKNI